MVRKAKDLVKKKGILSTPNPRPGHVLARETTDVVRSFYECDEVSRMLPGKNILFQSNKKESRYMFKKG